MTRTARLRTNAKINLFLRVMGRRPDGYHEIETIFHTIGFADSITIGPTTNGGVDISMEPEPGSMTGLPHSEDNLVREVARRLIERGARNDGVAIEIVKRIPVGAGLGGGSGNAAGVLAALNESWEMNLGAAALERLALDVGADVPYCLTGGTSLASGRGEITTALPAPPSMWFVLGLSDEPLFTAEVYRAFDLERDAGDVRAAPMSLALGSGDLAEIAALLHNDLERPAFRARPELEKLKQAMFDAGALGVVMSGSGPTLVALARDENHASEIAGRLTILFDRIVTASSTPKCIERLD
ncbi:MAG: 4-(cytidine 5'-diphospho)-2-C-methyl-D-erythritol kinase [Actinomycetota bacterium]|nr:4-(cytidine 5'-diphospho)-2-C-methyl-D-erythritol kinase [Actinomycetota bacterium]